MLAALGLGQGWVPHFSSDWRSAKSAGLSWAVTRERVYGLQRVPLGLRTTLIQSRQKKAHPEDFT